MLTCWNRAEDWASPEEFHAASARTGGAPPHEIVEAIVTPSTTVTACRGVVGGARQGHPMALLANGTGRPELLRHIRID